MANSRKKQDYDNKYIKEHYKHYSLRLNIEKEQDLMEYLETVVNRNEYIKSLIREDMKKAGE